MAQLAYSHPIFLFDHPRSRVLRDGQHVVTTLLRQMGYDVEEVRDALTSMPARSIIWAMGNINWFPALRRQLTTRPPDALPFVVIWHHEPLPPPALSGLPWPDLTLHQAVLLFTKQPLTSDIYTSFFSLRSLARKGLPDLLVVSSLSRKHFLAEQEIQAHFVPLGYYTSLHGHDMKLERDIDVLFLDAFHFHRRRRTVNSLRRNGVDLLTLGSWTDKGLWGEDRTHLLNRTKIFLNIHKQKAHGELNSNRLILGMANNALVISEPIHEPQPFEPGKHFISVPLEQMPDVINYYLKNEDERTRIASEGHRFVTEEMTMARAVKRILHLISERVSTPAQPRES